METRRKFDVWPREMLGRKWYLIAVWSHLDSDTGLMEEDIWVSGEVDEFVREYESGQRNFELFSIPDGAEVSVNGSLVRNAVMGEVAHVPERCTVADGNSGEIDVRVTAGYGQVVGGLEVPLVARQNPPGRPNVIVQFWVPRAVEEL